MEATLSTSSTTDLGALPRPFYFLIPFWGQRYREHFTDRCLASLLSPGNFPCLRAADGHRLLIATTREDWQAIQGLPLIERAREHVTLQLIEIPTPVPAPPGSPAVITEQNKCQTLLIEAAYRDRVFGSMLWPDIIVSDGMVAALVRHAQNGRHLVLCTALRQTEEGVIAELTERGLLESVPSSRTGRPLILSPKYVADLAIRHLHSEVMVYEDLYRRHPFDLRRPFLPTYLFWRNAERQGLILHTFLFQPLLMDFAAIERHDTECLQHDLFENVYISRNFSKRDRIHVVQDSDEMGIVSLTPAEIGAQPALQARPSRSELVRQWTIRIAMGFHCRRTHDALKRDLFRLPVRWHVDELDDAWTLHERKIQKSLERAIGDYYSICAVKGLDKFPSPLGTSPVYWPADVIVMYHSAPRHAPFKRALHLVATLVRWVNWFIRLAPGLRKR